MKHDPSVEAVRHLSGEMAEVAEVIGPNRTGRLHFDAYHSPVRRFKDTVDLHSVSGSVVQEFGPDVGPCQLAGQFAEDVSPKAASTNGDA
jgi:hypothetical protein